MYPFHQGGFSKLVEIPEILRSDLTGEPLSNCVICDQYLLEPGILYMIEKAILNYKEYQTYDTVFEFAVCMECGGDKQNDLSKESREKITEYFFRNLPDPHSRLQMLEENETPDINQWISNCILKGTARNDISEYEIVAACNGDRMMLGFLPFVISDEAMEEMQGLLSKQTQDELDRFVDDNFGLPPEIKELLKDKPLVLV